MGTKHGAGIGAIGVGITEEISKKSVKALDGYGRAWQRWRRARRGLFTYRDAEASRPDALQPGDEAG